MPKIAISVADRFTDDFSLAFEGAATPSRDEQAFLDCIHKLLLRLAQLQLPTSDDAVVQGIEANRRNLARALRSCVSEFDAVLDPVERDKAGEQLRQRAHEMYGAYADRLDQLQSTPFIVTPVKSGEHIENLRISVRDAHVSEGKQRFRVEIEHTLTVIRAVITERKTDEAKARLHEYLTALNGVAAVGLEGQQPSHLELGKLALAGLKDEFVTREASIVKNAYVAKLGLCALVAAAASLVLFIGVRWIVPDIHLTGWQNFFLLSAGASVGTWLSFSLRRVVLSFDDLATLEEDRLRPEMRITFMIALTCVIGLLFWTSAIEITLGGFKTDLANNAASALLIGALCGIAERAMASAISKRADDFAAGVGGRTKV